jgi:AMIN domain
LKDSLLRFVFQSVRLALVAALLSAPISAQTFGPAPTVKSVRIVHERGVPSVEILTSGGPVIPAIMILDSPSRMVIDLSNARLGAVEKRVPIDRENILAIRADQYQQNPPVVRIVLDLQAPYGYTWDGAGNRLMVRLKPPEDVDAAKKPPAALPKEPVLALGGAPAAVPVTGGSGALVLAGGHIGSGSAITAGSDTEVLRLARGGEVRVCPRTTVSITPSRSTQDVIIGMGTGALETHYSLGASTDTVLTPDFRILLKGPGEFHYAVSSDSHGNTCVRGLTGNTSPVVVSELMADRSYDVKPTDQLVFLAGQIDKFNNDVPLECGCPPPVPVQRAAADNPKLPDSELPQNVHLGGTSDPTPPPASTAGTRSGDAPATSAANGPGTGSFPASLPASPPGVQPGLQPNDTRVTDAANAAPPPPQAEARNNIQVDAPLVFSAKNRTANAPLPVQEARELPVEDAAVRPVHLDAVVQPPPKRKPANHGFFHRLKGIFAGIFG